MSRALPDKPDPADAPVPGTGGAPAGSRDGRQGLRLHEGIAIIATVLCAFVAVVFFLLGSVPLAVIFIVIALVCVGIATWAHRRRRQVTTGRETGT